MVFQYHYSIKYNNSIKDNGYEINSENAYYNIDNKSIKFISKEARVRSKIYF